MSTVATLRIKIGADWKEAQKAFDEVQSAIKPMADSLQKAGATMTKAVTLPLLAIGGAALKASIDFESAFAGVRKTVDATESEFAVLEKGIRDMSKEIPATAGEIARVVELAGQLGIPNDQLLSFGRTMIDLGEATNLTSDAAAVMLARFANITQMAPSEFGRLGSVIVGLGNNFETTEAEIVDMALRLAGAGKVIGLTEGQIMAMATALSSLGVESQMGGTAFSKLFVQMATEVNTAGKDLAMFAQVAGMTASQFQQAFQEDAAGAITAFINGLGRLDKTELFSVLERLGITEVRMRDAILRAAGAGDLLNRTLDMQGQLWSDNRALQEEVARRYGTTESQLRILWNRIVDVGRTIGDVLKPRLMDLIAALEPLFLWIERTAQAFGRLDPTVQNIIIGVAAFAAALGPVMLALAGVLGVLPHVVAGLKLIGITSLAAAGKVALITAGIIAIAAAGWFVVSNWNEIGQIMLGIFRKIVKGLEFVALAMSFVGQLSPEIAAKVVMFGAELDKNIAAGSTEGLKTFGEVAQEAKQKVEGLIDTVTGAASGGNAGGLPGFGPAKPKRPGIPIAGGGGELPFDSMHWLGGMEPLQILPTQLRTMGAAVDAEMAKIHQNLIVKRDQFTALTAQLGQAIGQGVFDAATTLAEGFGRMAAGVASAGDVGRELLSVFAGVMQKLGGMIMAYGILGEKWNAAGGFFSFLNPLSAAAVIAIGAGLVAAGSAIKGFLSRSSGRGAGGGRGLRGSSGFSVNPNVASTVGTTGGAGSVGGGSQTMHHVVQVQPSVLPSGDVVFAQSEGTRRLDRYGTKMS